MKNNGKNKACVITLILIVLASGIGVSKSMARIRKDAQYEYFGEYYTIESDLKSKIGYANNIITIAKKYVSENEMKDLKSAVSELEQAQTPSKKYKASTQLDDEAAKLCAKLLSDDANLSNRDIDYVNGIVLDINATNDILDNNNYNELAKEYNDTLKSFPVSLFRRILNIPNLELFAD